MSEPPKFLFDECLGKPITEAIRRLVGFHRHQVGIMHILDRFKTGEHDDVWVPEIADEDWIVVSVDRGRTAGPRLPRICREMGVRHVLFAPSAAQLSQFDKARALLRVWRDLVNIPSSDPGTRFLLKVVAGGPVLDPKPAPPDPPIVGLTTKW